MRNGAVGLITAMSALVGACSAANASELSPANPLHCAMQFESYHLLAKRMGKESEARHYGARAQWYTVRAKSVLPADQLSPTALATLEKKVLAAPDGGLALATECFNRQDADPDYQRLVGEAKKAISEGRGPSTPMRDITTR